MKEITRAKAKASYAPCAWCDEWTKQIILFTCLDTGNTCVQSQWIRGKETHAREMNKVTSHGICPECYKEQVRRMDEMVNVGEEV
jgi:hypothetical protein